MEAFTHSKDVLTFQTVGSVIQPLWHAFVTTPHVFLSQQNFLAVPIQTQKLTGFIKYERGVQKREVARFHTQNHELCRSVGVYLPKGQLLKSFGTERDINMILITFSIEYLRNTVPSKQYNIHNKQTQILS